MEIWKEVNGYEGLYWISNLGRVKNKHGRILKPGLRSGYYSVGLMKNKKRVHKRIHRLVAEAFINNPSNLPQVNHKDENKVNNRVENLEWCDNKYNSTYSMGKSVKCIETGVIYCSLREASRATGIPVVSISYALNKKLKTAGDYHWVYI